MKWFQHQCDADENKKVRKIEKWGLSRGGEDGAMAATGRYWRLLEKLGKAEEKTVNLRLNLVTTWTWWLTISGVLLNT